MGNSCCKISKFRGYSEVGQEGHCDDDCEHKQGLKQSNNDKEHWQTVEKQLFWAINHGDISHVKQCLLKGADVNALDKNDRTPLILASMNNQVDIVETLIKEGATIDFKNKIGNSALEISSGEGHVDVVILLLGKGADANTQDEDGDSPLIVASYGGHTSVISWLMKAGAKVNLVNKKNRSPLILASMRGEVQVMKCLIDNGAIVNLSDEFGLTALMYSSREGHLDALQLLLQHGADLNVLDKKGKTAEELASENGHSSCAAVLQQARVLKCVKTIPKHSEYKVPLQSVPIKLCTIGNAHAGKSETLDSLLLSDPAYQKAVAYNRKDKRRKMIGVFTDRTVGINVYHVHIRDCPMSVFDCGGLDNYYLLHSLFTNVGDSIILIVVRLIKEKNKMKLRAEIKTEVCKQLAFLKSRTSGDCSKSTILIGTYLDYLNNRQAEEVREMLESICNSLEREEGFRPAFTMLINATDEESDEVKQLAEEIGRLCEQMQGNTTKKSIQVPKYCFAAWRRLSQYSEENGAKVLDWHTVCAIVREAVYKVTSLEVDGKYVHNLCQLMDSLGLILVSRPQGLAKEEFERNPPSLFVITNLNWFFSSFLGIILSPGGYLKDEIIGKDGYVLIKDLMQAFKSVKMQKEQILSVLREYKLICGGQGCADEVMIPGILSNVQEEGQSVLGKKFALIMARRCELVGCSMNVSTVPEIQARVGQQFSGSKIEFFVGGLYFTHGPFRVLIQSLDLQKAVELRVGVLKKHCSKKALEETRETMGRLFDKLFKQIIVTTIDKHNVSMDKVIYVMSDCQLRRLSSEKASTDHILYEMKYLENCCRQDLQILQNPENPKIEDQMVNLLTGSEIEDAKSFRLSFINVGHVTKGDLFRDLSRDIKANIIHHLNDNYNDVLGDWRVFALEYGLSQQDVDLIKAKTNKMDIVKEALHQLFLKLGTIEVSELKNAFCQIERNDVATYLEQDQFSGCHLKDLTRFAETLAFKFCVNATDPAQLSDVFVFFGLDPSLVCAAMRGDPDVGGMELTLRTLLAREPELRVDKVAKILRHLGWNSLGDALEDEVAKYRSLTQVSPSLIT